MKKSQSHNHTFFTEYNPLQYKKTVITTPWKLTNEGGKWGRRNKRKTGKYINKNFR